MTSSPLPPDLVALLTAKRPDVDTWSQVCRYLDAATPGSVDLAAVKKALSSWPREVPRKAPKEWIAKRYEPGTLNKTHLYALLDFCLDVAENEQLYNYYVACVAASPRLRLRDGSPAVSLWRQMRGRVQLQNGTSLALGEGQPGLADLGGVMTVEIDRRCSACVQRYDHTCARDLGPRRLSLYVEAEIKICGKLPPGCREYKGTSSRQLSDTERDQVQRQRAQLARGGAYIFAERTEELVDGFVAFRDDVVARLS